MNVGAGTYVAETARLIGDVTVGAACGVWEHAVIRGDLNTIRIGDGSNVQDCCVVHASPECDVVVGAGVSIGHGAIFHGAHVDDDCIIGINATVLDGAHIKRGCIVAANAVVTPGMHVPAHSLVAGVPARVLKQDETMLAAIRENAEVYRQLARRYLAGEF
jgi:carbonic anhydrase/acetyltransferase-like protein (isoleucine patch superfamily)